MKLLSYHIENYGKIHDQDGDFADGLTCFCERNGFGKSTMASFLKAMFYGLSSYTAATKAFTDRQRYYPFSGGKFGGSLLFEYGGKVYRIERFFDKKSAKGDECRVYQNGTLYDGFGEEIGKTLFGVDEESFQKTAFITADEMEISSTHSINEKLGGVDGADENGFERAIDLLDRAKKNLKAARGNGGRINELRSNILERNARLKNLQDMSESLSAAYLQREGLTAEIRRLDERLKRANGENLLLQKWETYDRMLAQKQAKERSLEDWNAKYPLGLPTTEERAFLQEQWQKNNQLRGSLRALEDSPVKHEKLQELEERFKNGAPMSLTIEKMQEGITRLSALEAEREALKNYRESDREKELKEKFTAEYKEKIRKKKGVVCGLTISGVLLLGAGIVFAVFILALGIGLLIAGGALCGAGIVIAAKNKDVFNSNEDEWEYQGMLAERERRQARILEIEKQTAGLSVVVKEFLQGYGIGAENLQTGLNQLLTEIASYQTLRADETGAAAQKERLRVSLKEGEDSLLSILRKYGLDASVGTMDGLKDLEMAVKAKTDLTHEIEYLNRELDGYQAKNGLTERPQEQANVDELHAALSEKRRALANCDKGIAETERLVEQRSDVENALALDEEALEACRDKYDLIVDTMSALTAAEQRLKDKYIAPIKTRFSVYAEALERVLDERVSMDKDFKIVFERGGEARSDKHLSAGERTLCALCLRLALLDNMYEGEQPFILMDDPFVHLDGEHMARTKALLALLAEKKQILYFCCHESRKI